MKFLVLMWAIFLMFMFTLSHANSNSDCLLNSTNSNSETLNLINSTNLAKPGCPSRCGDLIVPYPFGIGIDSNCSIYKGFDIYCNKSIYPPRASFINTSYTSIKLISDFTLRNSNIVAKRCYFQNGSGPDIVTSYKGFPYTVSQVNKFILIGCANYAWLTSTTKSMNVTTGCMVICSKPEDVMVGDCSGNGCCQSSIPNDINSYDIQLDTLVESFNPCTYAFVGEANAFKFSSATDLVNDTSVSERIEAAVPIVFEWAIGNLSCAEAEVANDFACQSNSLCVSSKRETGGYRCVCKEGYEGNPYLSPGCKDINECSTDGSFDRCHGNICINTPGSYSCRCREGHIGDAYGSNGCHRTHQVAKFTITIFALGVVLGTCILVLALWSYKIVQKRKDKHRRDNFFKRNGGILLQQQARSGEDAVERTRLFTAVELEKATDQYNRTRIVGRGGQGTVYKGMLPDGKIVAVKKSKLVDECQVEPFINEVFLLSQISHKNVVKLLGCCLETEVPILVYEFVSNGDLFHFIHDENYEFPSLWSMRLQIVTEVAGALAYMHYAMSIPIYHRDIKSSNILLDDKFRAKLSDFGISKSVIGDQTHLSTLVKGTFGYIDPEYFQSSQFTDKSYVYSFGIVLVEILTGKKPIYSIGPGESRSLATLILSNEEGLISENIDDRVLDGPQEQLIAVAKIAERCLILNGALRPTMKEVATELEGIRSSH